MKVNKILNFKNDAIKAVTFELPQLPHHLPQLHNICLAIGGSGAGKTTAIINLLEQMQKYKSYDHVVLVSPTGIRNELGITPEGKWENNLIDEKHRDYNIGTLNSILNNQKLRILEYLEYKHDLQVYDKFIHGHALTNDELILLYEKYNFEKPINPNKNGHNLYPTLCIILDDLGTSPFTKQSHSFENFVIKSRHSNASVFVLIQHAYMLPRALRTQANLILIFKTADAKYLRDLYEEYASSYMTYEEFQNVFKKMNKRSDFLYIDIKKPELRINFNQVLDVK